MTVDCFRIERNHDTPLQLCGRGCLGLAVLFPDSSVAVWWEDRGSIETFRSMAVVERIYGSNARIVRER